MTASFSSGMPFANSLTSPKEREGIAMLRIIRIDHSGAGPTIRLEGKLLTLWVEEVDAVCRSAGAVTLDLSHVTFVDQAGIDLLRSLIADGVPMCACTTYIAELLDRKEDR
jgi:hypothetical protein